MITILAGNVIINKWGYRLTPTGSRSNVTVTQNGDNFVCVSEQEGDTDTLTFDVRIPRVCNDSVCDMFERYDRLANVVRLANSGLGHLQYRMLISDDRGSCLRVYELVNGSISEKDQIYLYASGRVPPLLSAELTLTVRKSQQPTLQLFPVRAVPANAATATAFMTLWNATDVWAILVGPDSTAFSEWRTVTTLADFSDLDEITNTGYSRLKLLNKEEVDDALWPVQPISALLPSPMNVVDRAAVVASDLVWISIAAGMSIAGVVIADDNDKVLGVIPYSNWAFGDSYHTTLVVPDGGVVKFKVNQLGLIVAP